MLQKLKFKPGFNKQDTESGAEGQWTDGDFVRFRYGMPEKIGGWLQLTSANLTLPGDFAFQTVSSESMVPADPSTVSAARQATMRIGSVTINIS